MSSDDENKINVSNSKQEESHVSDFKKKLNFLQNADLFKHNNNNNLNKENPDEKEFHFIAEDVEKIRKLRQPPPNPQSEDEDQEEGENIVPTKEGFKKGTKKKEKEKKEKKKASIRNPFKRHNTTTERPMADIKDSINTEECDTIKLVTSPIKNRPKREKLNKVNPHKIRQQQTYYKSNEELFKPSEETRKELEKLEQQTEHQNERSGMTINASLKKPPIGGVAIFNDPASMLTVLKKQKSKLNVVERKESTERQEVNSKDQINDLNNNDLDSHDSPALAASPSPNEIKIPTNMTALKCRPKRKKCYEAALEKKSGLLEGDLFEPPKSLNIHNETEEEVNALSAVTRTIESKLIDMKSNEVISESKPNRSSMIPSFALRNPMMQNPNFLSELKSKQNLSMYAKLQDDLDENKKSEDLQARQDSDQE